MDPSFRQSILEMAGAAAPIVTTELDKTMASMAFNAWRKWPVDTGFSKAMLSLEYTVSSPDVVMAQLRSNAWYSFYIKTRRNGLGNKQPWRVLIFDPAGDRILKMSNDIADQIEKFLDGVSR